ncbi:MAG: hypothetical protein IPM74_15060 [Crocinitomicaceae bacterium]|nr:hypothetical protein [Crocinitomicaceae bacterium]MBK8927191.1 hypothetical protein [Crocinitomicaceae bacterium]
MKIQNIGIILLTAMVLTRYLDLVNQLTSRDGSFREGIEFSMIEAYESIQSENESEPATLLLANHAPVEKSDFSDASISHIADNSSESQHVPEGYAMNPETSSSDEPAPMEYANTMVVYDPSNPALISMNTRYEDPTESVPLDNTNTVISGMMSVLPRR